MNLNDIQRVNVLSNEKLSIQAALGMLGSGGRITAMTVSGGQYEGQRPGPVPGMPPIMGGGGPVTVPSSYIEYPAQMITAITAALQTRLQQINQELAQMGVTGMEQR